MSRVQETIDVDVPVHSAYNQWTQFEEFPRFMDGVEEIRQIDDRRSHWRTKVGGAHREFDTEIVDQLPDERISWRTVSGEVRQMGVVTFRSLDERHTRVSLAMEFEPQGIGEKAGAMLGVLDRQVKGDLKRFKGFIEERGHESGGWRGRITPGGTAAAGTAGHPADAPPRETPQARMTGEGAPPADQGLSEGMQGGTGPASAMPPDPDDMRHG